MEFVSRPLILRCIGLVVLGVSCSYLTGNAVVIFHKWHYLGDPKYAEYAQRFPHRKLEPPLLVGSVFGIFLGTMLILTS